MRWLACKSFNDAARLVFGQGFGGIVTLLWLFLCIQMVEIAKELVKAMVVRQVLIAIAQMALTKMCCSIALGFQDFCQGRVAFVDANVRAWQTHSSQARANRHLSCNEGRAPRRARRLGIVVCEQHALFGQSVDVGGWHHQAVGVNTDVGRTDVVGHDHDDIGSTGSLCHGHSAGQQNHGT